jgi:hypothetical protein
MKSFLLIGMLWFVQYTEEEVLIVLDQQCQAMHGWPFKNITNFYQCYSQDGRLLFEERVDPLYRIA